MQVQELFGFAAGAIGVYMAIPQARHIRKLGHGEGVSLTYWSVLLLVGASWLSYGILIDSPSLIVSNVLGFTTSAMVVTALLQRGWVAWPVIFGLGAIWVLLFKLLPLSLITILLVAMTFNRVPQIIRSIQNLRSGVASAVSMKSQYFLFSAMLLWEIYSFMSGQVSLVVTTTTGMTLTSAVIVLELAGRRRASALAPQ
jgi:uncharacterized protein with PQ loop repeat